MKKEISFSIFNFQVLFENRKIKTFFFRFLIFIFFQSIELPAL